MVACIIFVFTALAEYAGILLKLKIDAIRTSKRHLARTSLNKGIVSDEGNSLIRKGSCYRRKIKGTATSIIKVIQEEEKHARIDVICLILYAIAFIVFNIAYWLSYT